MVNKTNLKTFVVMAVILLWLCPAVSVAGIIYVDAGATGANNGSSWTNAYNDLQDALAVAGAGDQIWVAQGTYKPTTGSDRSATFQLINGVGIYGGFVGTETSLDERDWQTNETILSGDLDGNDTPGLDPCDLLNDPNRGENSYHVVIGSETDETAVLDGFTITAGNANGSYPAICGAGMYNDSGSPTVNNCTFIGNSSASHGGGMENEIDSNPTLTNCTFSGNSTYDGGGMCNSNYSSPTLTNCTFSGNSALQHAGGMRNSNSSPTITNCTFRGNSAVTHSGGMANYNSSPTLINCTFSANSANEDGGGMCNWNNSTPTLTNCTFSGNSAENYGGGMYNVDSDPNIANCILWRNSDDGGTDQSAQIYGGDPNVNFSCIQGWTGSLGGTGNIGDDPCFVDANGPDGTIGTGDDNLRLMPDSPCIDAGDNNSVPEDANDLDGDGNTVEPIPWDLDGRDRFADGDCNDTEIVDMGAYEFAWAYIGDFDGWCDVDFADYAIFASAFLSEPGNGNWNTVCDISLPADFYIDWRDLDVFTDNWLAAGSIIEPSIAYEITPCDLGLLAAEQSGQTRFTVTVEGRYIHFEDTMVANCCPDELWLEMIVEDNLITIYEIEHTTIPCWCICDYPVTATLGPFEPGTYTLEVYEDWGGFIGSTIVIID